MPQQPPQHPQQKHPHEALLDELIRLILLKVAEDIPSDELDRIFSMQTHDPELLRLLKSHGDALHGKLRGRKSAPQQPPTPPRDSVEANRRANSLIRELQQKAKAGRTQ